MKDPQWYLPKTKVFGYPKSKANQHKHRTQSAGLRLNEKNVILKIPSESITRVPKESLMGKKKMICPRIFLPYEILPLLERKLPIYCTFYLEKKVFKNFMYWILGQIIFFFPTKDSIGMLVMDFEGIFEITFFFI